MVVVFIALLRLALRFGGSGGGFFIALLRLALGFGGSGCGGVSSLLC